MVRAFIFVLALLAATAMAGAAHASYVVITEPYNATITHANGIGERG